MLICLFSTHIHSPPQHLPLLPTASSELQGKVFLLELVAPADGSAGSWTWHTPAWRHQHCSQSTAKPGHTEGSSRAAALLGNAACWKGERPQGDPSSLDV